MRNRWIPRSVAGCAVLLHAMIAVAGVADDADQVRSAMLEFRRAVVAGDVGAAVARMDVREEAFRPLIEPAARLLVAVEAVKAAADRTYGDGAGRASGSGLAAAEEIEAADVTVETDRAEMTFDPRIGGPPEPFHFIRIGGAWKVDARQFADEEDEDGERAATLACVFAWGLEATVERVVAGEIEDADNPVAFATSQAFGAGMAMTEQELETLPRRLAELQDQRAPQRREQFAAASRKPAALPQVKLPPDNQLDTPVKSARAFADAVARGDVELAAALIQAETTAERRWAESYAEFAAGQHAVRAAAADRIDRVEALKLPWNDAGTMFVDRFEADIDGDRARVWWRDNFPTADSPDGTVRSLPFVRDGNIWKLAAGLTSRDDDEEARTAYELFEESVSRRAAARRLNTLADDIEAGRVNSIDQLRVAS